MRTHPKAQGDEDGGAEGVSPHGRPHAATQAAEAARAAVPRWVRLRADALQACVQTIESSVAAALERHEVLDANALAALTCAHHHHERGGSTPSRHPMMKTGSRPRGNPRARK